MTPLRQPLPVRGNVPGLLCRGMPVWWRDEETPYAVTCAPFSDADGASWVIAAPCAGISIGVQDDPSNFAPDWSSPLALYAALHWLTDRGHPCLWMLPDTHGGKVEGHQLAPGTCPTCADGIVYAGGMETCPDCHGTGARTLSAWEVSAILMSVSVARVAAGMGPVSSALRPWRHDPNPGDAYEEWGWTAWQRDGFGGIGACRCYIPTREHPQRWNGAGWYYYRTRYGGVAPTMSGRNTGVVGMTAADAAALADGAAFLVPGGVAVLVPEAP